MTYVIVPLAGPDFVDGSGRIKALMDYKGGFFLEVILKSRSWYHNDLQFIFILKDSSAQRAFANEYLAKWFTLAHFVFLNHYTVGAALSALAGSALVSSFDVPLIIDLADIDYCLDVSPNDVFSQDACLGAIVPVFCSSSTDFSYLKFDENENFVTAREKEVISSLASAGTYIFRDFLIFIKSLSYLVANRSDLSVNGLLYVCPMMNGVDDLNFNVAAPLVSDFTVIK